MGRINLLDANVFNKIAAGEVVEKPASIVKEFIENSLDSGANEIIIEIENGGIDKIRVADNGCGIHPDDVKTAFLPHSTSKIKTVEDLSSILTLGFRGEALASIASVSKITLQTKQKDFELGKKIKLEGGIIKSFEDTSISDGTIVEVEDLFFNIPARRKFLRKAKTEENEITNLIVRYILANPTIKFSYFVDNEKIYQTNGTGLLDAIYLVYKKDILNNLIEVDYHVDDVTIKGYISKPTHSMSNRTYQTLVINKRYVINSLVSTAVQNAYEGSLMKGQFPFFVLNFNLPISSLDVNVHPNKLDVKFENTQKVFGYFYSAIKKALLNFNEIKKIDDDLPLIENNMPKPVSNFVGKSFEEQKPLNSEVVIEENKTTKIINTLIREKTEKILSESEVFEDYKSFSNSPNFHDSPIMSKLLDKQLEQTNKENTISEVNIQTKGNFITETIQEEFASKQDVFENLTIKNYKIIGSIFDTYILVQIDDSVFVFDQHACHERLNYDKLINAINSKELTLQPLLLPYILETNSLETNFIEENLQNLNEIGFQISEFGKDCFKISSIPSMLAEINLGEFFKEILSDLTTLKKINSIDILKEKLSQKACKASVRAGDKLSEKEIELLLELMKESNMTLSCPHGRPAVIEITKNELEKWFKRKI